MARQTSGSNARRSGSTLMPSAALTSPPYTWHRHTIEGVPRMVLRLPQQLAGGPARAVPVDRKPSQSIRADKV
jgi:hypothetical protein